MKFIIKIEQKRIAFVFTFVGPDNQAFVFKNIFSDYLVEFTCLWLMAMHGMQSLQSLNSEKRLKAQTTNLDEFKLIRTSSSKSFSRIIWLTENQSVNSNLSLEIDTPFYFERFVSISYL